MKVAKTEYTYSGYQLSYTRSEDSKVKQVIIRTVGNLLGKKKLNKLYEGLHMQNPTPCNVCPKALKQLKDYFLLINKVLLHKPVMKKHRLPVDFDPTEEAKQTNLRTNQPTTECLNHKKTLVVFSAGAVATQKRFSLRSETQECSWYRFICTNVPMCFYSANTKIFQIVSKFNMNLRLGFLLHEVWNKKGKTIKIKIGEPIGYNVMSKYRGKQALIPFLYGQTMALN